MARYGLYIIPAVISIIIVVMIYRRITVMEAEQERLKAQISAMEAAILEELEKKTEAIEGSVQAAAALVIYEVAAGTAVTGRRITMTDEGIRRIDTVYAGILAELEKRTLDSLYTEVVLVDMEREAGVLFAEGKYAQASVQYAALAEAQPENIEARFFYLYSLFLNNKMDRSNYQMIKEGFMALESNGYRRREIGETLDYIELEERGLEMERFQ